MENLFANLLARRTGAMRCGVQDAIGRLAPPPG
jgi:hypothetical protein